jgi:elongation factor P
MKVSDMKRGVMVLLNDVPCVIDTLQVQTPSARGGASLYKIRFRNLVTKQKTDKTCKGEESLPEVSFTRRDVQYLYNTADTYTFMDLETYDQFELKETDVETVIPYLIDDMEDITALVVDGQVLAIQLPPTVDLQITECDPGMKGASATSRTKPATLTTGLIVQVPEYLEPGEVITVDTSSNAYLSRAKS